MSVCDLVQQSQCGAVHVLCVQFRGKGGWFYDMEFPAPWTGGGVVEMGGVGTASHPRHLSGLRG